MLDQLGKEKYKLILRSGSLELIVKDPVVIPQKWYHTKGNLKKMLELLNNVFMFKEDRLKNNVVHVDSLIHNKLHVDDARIYGKMKTNLM